MQVTYAEVTIRNGMLSKAKSAKKASLRINFLVNRYWSPDQYKFVGKTKPHECSQEEFIKITDTDLTNILSKYVVSKKQT